MHGVFGVGKFHFGSGEGGITRLCLFFFSLCLVQWVYYSVSRLFFSPVSASSSLPSCIVGLDKDNNPNPSPPTPRQSHFSSQPSPLYLTHLTGITRSESGLCGTRSITLRRRTGVEKERAPIWRKRRRRTLGSQPIQPARGKGGDEGIHLFINLLA